ncbi:MAG: Ail/Lom family outer membrane beta-barrel protein [Symbiopectobacterium sp.]|uniref:Ail/Lom family outer membrane beta-barrel protein n=1 Tax=Symbiopectobacterium sp. TaxID=2952789 RepID=UPI0039ED923E
MNINKNLLALSVLLAAMGSCAIAKADTQTISLGYSNAKVPGFKNIHGATAKYHYQADNSLGFISSLTYMGGTKKFNDDGDKGKV